MTRQIRNIAIIAHVDHGKTTLVDQLLRQSGTFRENEKVAERVMDSNDLEKERGITILAKNCAVEWKGTHINIVDTPGHADFGGEVERVLSMVDSVLLLVDAVEGPMPQTRFVTKKALALGLKPIVVVNKVDRPGARPDYVINATFDLFDKLHATEAQLDFPVIFASGLNGWATLKQGEVGTDLTPLFDAMLEHVPAHEGSPDAPLQLQICSLDYSTYVGRIGIGRVNQGTLKPMQDVAVYSGPDSTPIKARVNQVLKFEGLERKQATEAGPGDIVLINGIEGIGIGVTLTDIDNPAAAADAQRRRADADDELLRQQLAAGRARGQVRHQPADPRPARPRAAEQRGDEGQGDRRGRHLRSLGPRRTAPDHPAGDHAPRGLRAGGEQAARGVP